MILNPTKGFLYLAIKILPWWLALMLVQSAQAQSNSACLACHGNKTLKGPKGTSLYVDANLYNAGPHAQAGMTCVDCHSDLNGVKTYPHRYPLKSVRCSDCHDDITKAEDNSPHGQTLKSMWPERITCFNCHGKPHEIISGGTTNKSCGDCHDQIQNEYSHSLHGHAFSRGLGAAPTCATCHIVHTLLPPSDPASSVNRRNVFETCRKCHGQKGMKATGMVLLPRAAATYARSVHGIAFAAGNEKAATCTDCHRVHDLLGAGDPKSDININNIANNCGKCHSDIRDKYVKSIHGRALKIGIVDSPTCTKCHGEHQILSPTNSESPTYLTHIAQETCARCHNNPVIIEKYGLNSEVVQTYEDSFHGLADRWQSKRAATCPSCHTAHSVEPPQDSTSTVNPANVVVTCRKCHPGATVKFAQSFNHAILGRFQSRVNIIIRHIYIFLLTFIIGGMVIHNGIIIHWHLSRAKLRQESGPTIIRFDPYQIAQHLILTVAFTGLAITGFALKFSDAWWVKILQSLGMNESIRSILHRSFGVLLIGCGVYHIIYMIITRRGREDVRALVPNGKDVVDVQKSLFFYLGLSKKKPLFGQFDYSQKGEYWALIWGSVIMAATGFILWFPTTFVRILPVWSVEVATTIHYYEAWLALLAVLVWHFFFVILHPEMYPMDWTWLTGKISTRDVKAHHTLWYEELKEEGIVKPSEEETESGDQDKGAEEEPF
jgi:formate dehydrogenase gamma subunit